MTEFSPGKMKYIGCFADSVTIAMDGPITELHSTNSVQMCVHTCIRKGRAKATILKIFVSKCFMPDIL